MASNVSAKRPIWTDIPVYFLFRRLRFRILIRMLTERLETFLRDPEFQDSVVARRLLPRREARTAPPPAGLDPRLLAALKEDGVHSLWEHQARAVEGVLGGRDVAICTGTASGKTLCYNLPVLNHRLVEPGATALYVFPTKALTRDQVVAAERLISKLGVDWTIGTYDGDTPPNARKRLRDGGDIVATNPYMLHAGVLPNHPKWVRFFAGLRHVVVDEMHGYTGVYGSHFANVVRRLRRICAHYGANPRFIFCSATLRNPGELASQLVGRPVDVVSEDGSPQGEKHVLHVNPPIVRRELGLRRNVLDQTRRVVSAFAPHGVRTIVFGGSRRAVELLTRYLKEDWAAMGKDPERVRGYRGGYLPDLRRTIEAELREGRLDVVCTTNALELGIDIGGLDLCVMAGYPRSRAAWFQQAGRAGRRASSSAVVLVSRSTPLDQWVIQHPEWLLDGAPEAAAIDPDHLIIRVSQLKCSAFELPFSTGERFGGKDASETDEVLDFLSTEAGILRAVGGRYLWAARGFPAEEVSLDAGDVDNVVIHDIATRRTLAEIDRPSAQTMVHEGAIYQHQGDTWLVRELDWPGRRARVEKVEVDYYTEASVDVDVTVLTEDRDERIGGGEAHLSDVTVRKTVAMYQKLKFHTREDVGTGKVHLPSEELETDAFVLLFDPVRAREAALYVGGNPAALSGVAGMLRQVAPLVVRAAPSDFGVASEIKSPRYERPVVYLFDDVPGGVGLCERIFDAREEVIGFCAELIRDCECPEGCPACIGPGKGEEAKRVAVRLLEGLVDGRADGRIR